MGQAHVLCTILSPITRYLAHCRCLINVVSTNYMWIGLPCTPSSPFCCSKKDQSRKCFSIICSSKTREVLTRGCVCMLSHFSHVRFFLTLWTVAHQIPLCMGFSRQEYWSRFPFPSPGNLPNLGIHLMSLTFPALAGEFFTTSASSEAPPRRQAYWKFPLFSLASLVRILEPPLNFPNLKDLLPASAVNMILLDPDKVQPSSQTSSDSPGTYLPPFAEQFVPLAYNYEVSFVVCLHSPMSVSVFSPQRATFISTLRARTVVLYLLDLCESSHRYMWFVIGIPQAWFKSLLVLGGHGY